MSAREWKPGDVAAVTITRRDDAEPEATNYIAFFVGGHYGWQGVDGGHPCGQLTDNEEHFVIERRPLVVIDPEGDLDPLCKALVEAMHRAGDQRSAAVGVHPATVAAALCSLIAPPRPEEPTGLGAVVVDEDGDLWVRHFKPERPAAGSWVKVGTTGPAMFWDSVRPVEVKSPGWSA